ncbi:MAG TPA: LuxR C-terminal-related transcriptional regulator [Polyangiaceae bacterium]|nr:LuxR C-terminal-related transcriptional regulator [Polyangiaceae bacterium]
MVFPDLNHERLREVTDAAYAFKGDLASWADGVHGALGPCLDLGQGTLVALVLLPDQGVRIQHLASRGGASKIHHAIVRLSAFLAPTKLREAFFNGRFLGSSSGHYEDGEIERMQQRSRGLGSRDAAGFCVSDGVDHGLMVVSPTRDTLVLPQQASAPVRRVAHHISTGLRLQRVIGSVSLDDPAIEAIFDEAGRPQQALGMARLQDGLERLRDAVLLRSRAPVQIEDSPWEAVIAGRWSLVDRFDSDGRRYIVAYRNPAGVLDPRRLTPREEGVTTLAAVGRSNKEIGFDLGISESTVATLLTTSLAKLGLASRTLLPLFWRDLHGHAWAVTESEASLVALAGPEDRSGLAPLTPAERAVASGLLAGLSDRDIARARNSSTRTVEKQAANIYQKLGVHSRAELASKLSGGRAEAFAAGLRATNLHDHARARSVSSEGRAKVPVT